MTPDAQDPKSPNAAKNLPSVEPVVGVLTATAGPDRGKSVTIERGASIVIGRDPRSNLQMLDSEVSRLNTEIKNTEGKFRITDLNSRNGTRVNGKKIKSQELSPGDEIRVGQSRLTFTLERVARQVAPPELAQKRGVAPRKRPGAGGEDTVVQEQEAPIVEEGSEDPLVGRRLGDFKILTKLGEGDSTTVYKAIQLSKNRFVALKIFPPEMTQDKVAMKRFIRGAKSGSQLRHPNIVRILGGGQADGIYYLFMEYVEGTNLRKVLDRGKPVDLKAALEITLQLADALQLAYERRIVHRNIKPSNILINQDGLVKLADVGLAKTIEESGASDITDPGTILGTLNYMSPEQLADAGVVDHRSDIYSLGATLYALLTGVEPFTSPSTLDTMIKIQKEPPDPPKRFNPDISDSACELIEKCMAKFPEDRIQTPKELRENLKRIQAELG